MSTMTLPPETRAAEPGPTTAETPPVEHEFPFVTVVMPVRNEEQFIRRSLGSVCEQDYPADRFEVLVVDGRSTDATRALVEERAEAEPVLSVRVVDNPEQYVPTAFNRALDVARGDVVIIVGGHSELDADYVSNSVKAMRETGAACVGGFLRTVGSTVGARAIAKAQSSPFGVGGVTFRTGSAEGAFVDTVAFGAYRASVFDEIGGFDEEFIRNQDDEFNFRLTQAGHQIWFEPAIQATYFSRASLRKLWRQYFQYGKYKVRLIQKRRGVPSWRHLVPVTFVLTLLACVLAAGLGAWLPLALVGGTYLAGCLGASVLAARGDWGTLPWLPPAFVTLHLAYGLGFLAGLWRWRGGWR